MIHELQERRGLCGQMREWGGRGTLEEDTSKVVAIVVQLPRHKLVEVGTVNHRQNEFIDTQTMIW
eukprot:XP_001707346.1 Hypothetical protein GL50803_34375 [Giardia lamblia ATCC 50803]